MLGVSRPLTPDREGVVTILTRERSASPLLLLAVHEAKTRLGRQRMCVRLLIGAVLAFGLIATDVVALTGSASARMYKGKTAQGYGIKFTVKEERFKILRFEADLRCTDGTLLTLIESGFLWTKAGKNGSFRNAQFGRTDEVFFRGRMNEKRIRGRVRLTDRLRRGVKCRSRWISYNATAR